MRDDGRGEGRRGVRPADSRAPSCARAGRGARLLAPDPWKRKLSVALCRRWPGAVSRIGPASHRARSGTEDVSAADAVAGLLFWPTSCTRISTI
jgi:hypothetical protein